MRSYLLLKKFKVSLKEYILIFLTATIFLVSSYTKSFSEENIFTVNNVTVKGKIDINFSRDKYINTIFINSFNILMSKILLTRDLYVIDDTKLKKIKTLINSFKILEESYGNNEYKLTAKVYYNENKIKKFLGNKNISFSQPENINAVFFPILFINRELQSLNENIFYKKWNEIEVKNELINFILPIEDLEDISKIVEMKDEIEKLNIDFLINKYNEKNYVLTFMEYENKKLNIHLKTNFKENKVSKNFSYDLNNINNESILISILKDLKIKITDLWKEENLINVLMPLSIRLKFKHSSLDELDKLRNIFYKINIIESYSLEEFNINNSYFKIYYYGNPKKLKTELLKFGYQLNDNQGLWQLYIND